MAISNKDPGMILKSSFPEALVYGNNTCTTVAEQLSSTSTLLAVGVWVKAAAANTNIIYVGSDSSVTTTNGYPLAAGESVFVSIDNLNKVWIYGGAAAQDCRYIGS